jgi:hypothetical protein
VIQALQPPYRALHLAATESATCPRLRPSLRVRKEVAERDWLSATSSEPVTGMVGMVYTHTCRDLINALFPNCLINAAIWVIIEATIVEFQRSAYSN